MYQLTLWSVWSVGCVVHCVIPWNKRTCSLKSHNSKIKVTMRQFSIYALSINQIVFTSSRRTSSQGEGAGTRVEGGTHTVLKEGSNWVRVQSEIARLSAAMLWWVYWKIAWHLGGFRADLSGIRSKLISGMCDSYERPKLNLIKVVENNNIDRRDNK